MSYSSNDIIKINCTFNLMNLPYYIHIELLNFHYCKTVSASWSFCQLKTYCNCCIVSWLLHWHVIVLFFSVPWFPLSMLFLTYVTPMLFLNYMWFWTKVWKRCSKCCMLTTWNIIIILEKCDIYCVFKLPEVNVVFLCMIY